MSWNYWRAVQLARSRQNEAAQPCAFLALMMIFLASLGFKVPEAIRIHCPPVQTLTLVAYNTLAACRSMISRWRIEWNAEADGQCKHRDDDDDVVQTLHLLGIIFLRRLVSSPRCR